MMEMYNIIEEYKHYLSTNENSSDLINEINEIRHHIDESDHPYDEREYDNWEDYVDDIWGPECGYHDVFDSTIDRFEAERGENIPYDSYDELYEVFLSFL